MPYSAVGTASARWRCRVKLQPHSKEVDHVPDNFCAVAVAVPGRRFRPGLAVEADTRLPAAAAGFRQMIAIVGGGLENQASIRLHEGCGFELTGVLKAVGYKFDRWLDTAILQRSLDSRPGSRRS